MGLSIVGGVVAYQIYSAAVKNQATPEQITAVKPLDGEINQKTIDGLKKRTVYTDSQIGALLAVTPTIAETSTLTPSASPTPSPVATESAAIVATESATVQP